MREQVKELWGLCFPEDSDEFKDLYFSLRYKDEINSAIVEGNVPVSALQRIPYPIKLMGETISASYISGACTHPSYRSLGLMGKLLGEAHRRMYQDGVIISTLIPAGESLISYYSRFNYFVGFQQKEELLTGNDASVDNFQTQLTFNILDNSKESTEEVFHFIYQQLSKKECAVLHTMEDIRIVMADHFLSSGEIWAGYDEKADIQTVSFAIKDQGKLFIKEMISVNDNATRNMLYHLFRHYSVENAYYRRPCGMIRIINALELLKLYSRTISSECIIEISGDNTIEENNGLYLLKEGTCYRMSQKDCQTSIPYTILDIKQLGELIFKDKSPYMSLMMD